MRVGRRRRLVRARRPRSIRASRDDPVRASRDFADMPGKAGAADEGERFGGGGPVIRT